MSKAREHFATTRASAIMTRDVVTFVANMKVSVAVQTLASRRISGAPVLSSNGTCLGVFSSKDVRNWDGDDPQNGLIFDFMTTPAITVSEEHNLLDVVGILRSSRIHRLPVVDNRGRVVGIVSMTDIVEQIGLAMEAEIDAVAC